MDESMSFELAGLIIEFSNFESQLKILDYCKGLRDWGVLLIKEIPALTFLENNKKITDEGIDNLTSLSLDLWNNTITYKRVSPLTLAEE